MASNYFTISPTGGTGDGVITVTPTGNNMTVNDKVATVSVCGQTVTVTHWGIPSIVRVGGQEPISAPASGGTYQFRVQTHYKVKFQNIPSWIHIYDGNTEITSANTIEASVANGRTYSVVVDPNSTTNDRSTPANFGMYHLMNDVVQTIYYDEISISQPQGAEDWLTIQPLTLDWNNTSAVTLVINSSVAYSITNSNTTDFTLGGSVGNYNIRANDVNSGSTRRETMITVTSQKASFTYSATCTVTQLREPRINNVGGNSVAWSGGTLYAGVTSDYYWWLKPTVRPDTNAYYEYITMSAKTMDENMQPVPSGQTFSLDFSQNTEASSRQNYIRVGYTKNDGTIASSSTSFYFNQANQASTTFEVVPDRVPETGYVSSGGGVYTLNVVTQRPWGVYTTHRWCTLSPTSGVGNTTVTVTVPPASAEGSSYKIVDGLAFGTTDAEMGAYQTVDVYQYDKYTEAPYVVVDPDDFDISSATNSYTYTVSANTDWRAYVVDEDGYPVDWIDMPVTAGTSGYTTGLHFDVAVNLTDSARTATIQFLTGAGISIVTEANISQAAGAPVENFFVITTNPATGITFNSGTTGSIGKYLTVSASTDWNVASKPNWLTLWTSAFGGNNVTGGTSGSTTVYPRPIANSGSSRSGYVYMTSVAGLSGMSALISQEEAYTPAQNYLIVNTTPATGITYTSAGTASALDTTKFIQISASTSFIISSKPSWLELSTSALHPSPSQGGGAGNNKFFPIVAANSGSSRSGYVTFSGGGMTGTSALISQDEAYTPSTYDDLIIEPEDGESVLLHIPSTGAAISFYFENDNGNNEDWEVNYIDETEEWAKFYDGPNPSQADEVSVIEAGTQGYICLIVDANGGSGRNGTISLFGVNSSRTKTITFHQDG